MFDFWRWQCLSQGIGDHVCSGAVNELEFIIVDDPANEIKMNVDMLHLSVVLMVFGEGNSGLIVGKEGGRFSDGSEQFSNEQSKP